MREFQQNNNNVPSPNREYEFSISWLNQDFKILSLNQSLFKVSISVIDFNYKFSY